MALIPQYKRLISTSRGAEQSERPFLMRKSVGFSVRSERKARMKVKSETDSPRIVRLRLR